MTKHLFLTMLLIITCTNCDNRTAEDYVNIAFQFEELRDYKTAISNLDKALEKDKYCRPALLNRGFYKSELADFISAVKDYEKILVFDSDNTMALFNMATCYSNLDQPEKAIHFYSEALKTKGALNCITNSNGALVFNTSIDFKRFDSDAEFVIKNCKIYFERGLEYYWKKDYDNAIVDFKKTAKANFKAIDSYFLIGESYAAKKDSINACINYKTAVKLGSKASEEASNAYCN